MADSDDTTTSSKSPAFQFYPKDFLTDENVRVMSLQERGAYITLICQCWLEGSLPKDGTRLARLVGIPMAVFRRLWPALETCFREHAERADRLVHPRLERERQKQSEFSQEQSERGKRGAAKRWRQDGGAIETPSDLDGGAINPPMANYSSSSPVSSLQSASADSSQKTDARSKRPVFKGSRFVVFEWQLDDLRKMLGSHFDEFDMHQWLSDLDVKVDRANVVVPQRDGGKWLYEQTLSEAIRRGLPVVAASQATGKTAGNAAAVARFIARGNQ